MVVLEISAFLSVVKVKAFIGNYYMLNTGQGYVLMYLNYDKVDTNSFKNKEELFEFYSVKQKLTIGEYVQNFLKSLVDANEESFVDYCTKNNLDFDVMKKKLTFYLEQ